MTDSKEEPEKKELKKTSVKPKDLKKVSGKGVWVSRTNKDVKEP